MIVSCLAYFDKRNIQELYDMAPTQKYAAIIAGIDLDMIYHAVMKQSRRGAPESVNHPATITAFSSFLLNASQPSKTS